LAQLCSSDEEHDCDSDSSTSTDSVNSCVSDPSYSPENVSISSASDGGSEMNYFDSDEFGKKNLLPDGYAERILDNMMQLSTHKTCRIIPPMYVLVSWDAIKSLLPTACKVCNSPLKEKVHVSDSVINLSVELIVIII